MRTALLSLLFALALACDDGADPPPPIPVELGTGVDDFEPVTPGQSLEITQGLQGGFHVFGSIRAQDIEPWNAQVDFALFQGDTQIGGAAYTDDFLERDGALVYSGVTVFLWADFEPEDVADIPTRMTVKVTDATGREGTDEMEFVPRCCAYLR